jgi:hypothetical protein
MDPRATFSQIRWPSISTSPFNDRLGRFEFRAEIFNLFNQSNFNQPLNSLTGAGFGRLTSAKDARIVQFGLRYDF